MVERVGTGGVPGRSPCPPTIQLPSTVQEVLAIGTPILWWTSILALLVWLYIISLIVLIGAEFNALIYPRTVLTAPSPSGGEPFTSGI